MSEADATTLGQLGENQALARILPLLPLSDRFELGPGDDAAVVRVSDGRVVVSCDMMVEGPDFTWAWSDPEEVGQKAIASNASDIAAMGASVIAFEIAVAAPAHTPIDRLTRLAQGFARGIALLTPGAGVSGGDLSRSDVFTIAITVLGDLNGHAPVTRFGAQVGDVVAVAGELGLSRQGFELLTSTDGDATLIRELKKTNPAVVHHLAPLPPIALGVAARDAGATAMMDISDGLVLDATRMAKASGVTLQLVPLDHDALIGGEDHGLLACFPSEAVIPEGFRVVGHVVEAGNQPVIGDGYPMPSGRGGWDPFQDISAK